MNSPDLKQVIRTIEGVVALCLGVVGRVIWVHQSDAAAFNDGTNVYLPAPTGSHPGEYDLLLAIALREVAKVNFCQTNQLTEAEAEARPYVEGIEEARLKKELGIEYRGSPAIFDKAAEIAAEIFLSGSAQGGMDPAQANRLAIWAAAHEAVLGTPGTVNVAALARNFAAGLSDPGQLDKAVGIARRAPTAMSTVDSVALGREIMEAFRVTPEPPTQQEPEGNENQQEEQKEENGQQDQQDQQPEQPEQPEPGQDQGQNQDQDQDQDGSGPNEESQSDQGNSEGQDEQQQPQREGDSADTGGDKSDSEAGPSPAEDGDADQESGPGQQGGPDKESHASNQEPSQDDAANGAQSGDGASSGEPGSQDNASSGQKQGAGSEAPASNSADAEARDEPTKGDVLSDALAKARGHETSRDVSDQARELQAAAATGEPHEELTPAQEAALKAALEDMVSPGQAVLVAIANEVEEPVSAEEVSQEISMQLGGDGLSDAGLRGANVLSGVPARLVSVLMRAYQDKRRRPFQRAVGGQQVSVPHAWRLKAMGDVRVFRKKAPASGIDAAVSFLLDTSESMDEVGMEAAASVTYAMALAHQRIAGTQVSIDVFPGQLSESEQMLGFKQNLRAAEERLKGIAAGGGTPTGTAIAKRLPLLCGTRALKKVMYVITDGRPNPSELTLTRHVIKEAAAAGVVMIGIGINADVGDLFPISARVSGIAELPLALERLFKTDLVDRLAA